MRVSEFSRRRNPHVWLSVNRCPFRRRHRKHMKLLSTPWSSMQHLHLSRLFLRMYPKKRFLLRLVTGWMLMLRPPPPNLKGSAKQAMSPKLTAMLVRKCEWVWSRLIIPLVYRLTVIGQNLQVSRLKGMSSVVWKLGISMLICLLLDNRRDRENCTVFVADLPSGTSEEQLKALFKDVRTKYEERGIPCQANCAVWRNTRN